MKKHKTRFMEFTGISLVAALALAAVTMLYTPAFSSEPPTADNSGQVEIVLSSDLPTLTRGLAVYSLSDARFGIYTDYQCDELVAELSTDENGHGVSTPLSPGRYFIRQTQASTGYALSDHLYQADIAIGKSTSILAYETPRYSSPETVLYETNAETGAAANVGGSKLEGAEYAIMYYDIAGDESPLNGPTRTWTITTDASGEAHLSDKYLSNGSPFFKGPQDQPILPIGRYVVSMVKAPVGYARSNVSFVRNVSSDLATQTDCLCSFDPFVVDLQVIRGNVCFRKIDENNKPLMGIPFLLSYANDEAGLVESHVVVTNENGDYFSDSAYISHSINTNGNDAAALPNADSTLSIDDNKLTSNAGTWFSLDSSGQSCLPHDQFGALPYGSYMLQELPCKANQGMNLATVQFSIFRDDFTVALDHIVDTVPSIAGSTSDAKDGNKLIAPDQKSSIVDKVNFHNLIVGKEYTLTCTAVLMSTGNPLQDEGGSAAVFTKTFSPSEKEGIIDARINVDTSSHAGDQVIIYEELKSADGMTISNTDENATSNTLDIEPIVTASARDKGDEDKYIMGSDATIAERITYTGLKPGVTYIATCTLVDKATGNTLRDAQGKTIEASRTLIPDSTQGDIELSLDIDATGIAGHDIVVFSALNNEDSSPIALNQDIENETQTIKTVKLTSSASDKLDGDKRFDSNASEVSIIDTVEYANLVPKEQYEIHGVLMDKETGTALQASGKPVSVSAKFVPDEVSGSTDVEYTFDASKQTSDVLVAFETLEHEDKVIAEHADLEDVAQTVTSEEIIPETQIAAAIDSGAQQMATTGPSGKSSVASTGDSSTMALFAAFIMLVIASVCVVIAAKHRRHILNVTDDK